jgi:small subunit ribosomal protein S9
MDDYFGRAVLKMILQEPFDITETRGRFDVLINVCGGGLAGQAGAIRHGITRALIRMDSQLRSVLKKAGMVTRDSRVKERKKYGQPGARKRFQYSKR